MIGLDEVISSDDNLELKKVIWWFFFKKVVFNRYMNDIFCATWHTHTHIYISIFLLVTDPLTFYILVWYDNVHVGSTINNEETYILRLGEVWYFM